MGNVPHRVAPDTGGKMPVYVRCRPSGGKLAYLYGVAEVSQRGIAGFWNPSVKGCVHSKVSRY